MVDFSPFLHNVKKIAFANYRSLKAIRVFGGDSGHRQKRQSERPAQNFSSIRLYQAKGKKGVKSSNFRSRDGGDKIFTASKGGAWEGQGTPAPHSHSKLWEARKGSAKNRDRRR